MKIVVIGSGNIAGFFSEKFHRAGHEIVQVISPNMIHAQTLAQKFGAACNTDIDAIDLKADVCLLAVKDDVLLSFAPTLRLPDMTVLYTAGSVHLTELQAISANIACIWPVFSIHHSNHALPSDIPLLLNASNKVSRDIAQTLAKAISVRIFQLDDEQKSQLHLAAVFANNFTNHLYHIAYSLLSDKAIPFDILLPLIIDTAEKLSDTPPAMNQTGPAIRHDHQTMMKHVQMLSDEKWKQVYQLLSASIQRLG